MEEIVRRLLAQQDSSKRHTWLTRATVSFVVVFAYCVLYGFYGVIGSILMYLLGVELSGLSVGWMYLPFGMMMLYGLWKSFQALADYWRNYGHGKRAPLG
jgi:Na+/proline symporter